MSTEYATKYVEQKASEKTNPSTGAKESSGFVSNKEVEDVVTSVPGERWLFNSNRPTGISDYKAKYQPYGFPRVIKSFNLFIFCFFNSVNKKRAKQLCQISWETIKQETQYTQKHSGHLK